MKPAKGTVGAGSGRRALAGLALVVALGSVVAGCVAVPPDESRSRIEWDHIVARLSNSVPEPAIDGSVEFHAEHAADRLRYESGRRGCVLNHTDQRQMVADYPGRMWGENIGCYPGCADVADRVTAMFLSSPVHRDNILNGGYSSFGAGVACNERYLFVAVHFTS